MAESRQLSEEYARIGRRLIETDEYLTELRDSEATIVYLSSDCAKRSHGRKVFGECEKVPDKWRWGVPADFAITVYEPNVEGFDDAQLEVLIFHELLHAGIGHDRDGNETHHIVPHDVQEFRAVAERHGIDWAN